MSKQELCQVCRYARDQVEYRKFWREVFSWISWGAIIIAFVALVAHLYGKNTDLLGIAGGTFAGATGFSIMYLIVAMKTLRTVRTLDDKGTEHTHLFVEQSWPHLMWQTGRGPQPVRAGETNGYILLERLHGWVHPLELWRVYQDGAFQDSLVDRRVSGFQARRVGELMYELVPRALSGDQTYTLGLLGRCRGDVWVEFVRLREQLDAVKKERDDARECIEILGRGYFRVLRDLERARPTLGKCKHYFALTKFIRDRVDEAPVPAQEVGRWEREVREEAAAPQAPEPSSAAAGQVSQA